MASGKPLKCGVVISLSDGSNAMSSSDSTKLQRPAPLDAAANSVKPFQVSSHNSVDSSSQESDPVYLVDACVHRSAQFIEQHMATLRGQPLPFQTELTAELATMRACCHLDKASRQMSHPLEVPNFLPRHRWISAGTLEEAPIGQADAEMKKSVAAVDVRAAEKPAIAREVKPAPAMMHLQSLRQFTAQAGAVQSGRRTVLTGTDSDSTSRHRVVRRMMRMFQLPEADIQAIVEGIHERRGRNFAETKRIVSALMSAAATGAGQVVDRRMEKQNKSAHKLRAGQPSFYLRESTTDGGGTSTCFSSTIISGDMLDRPSRLQTRSKSSDLDADNQLVCCTLLEGQGEVVRTQELETIMVLPKPPAFDLVRTWTFDEAPVRKLRKPSPVPH